MLPRSNTVRRHLQIKCWKFKQNLIMFRAGFLPSFCLKASQTLVHSSFHSLNYKTYINNDLYWYTLNKQKCYIRIHRILYTLHLFNTVTKFLFIRFYLCLIPIFYRYLSTFNILSTNVCKILMHCLQYQISTFLEAVSKYGSIGCMP